MYRGRCYKRGKQKPCKDIFRANDQTGKWNVLLPERFHLVDVFFQQQLLVTFSIFSTHCTSCSYQTSWRKPTKIRSASANISKRWTDEQIRFRLHVPILVAARFVKMLLFSSSISLISNRDSIHLEEIQS